MRFDAGSAITPAEYYDLRHARGWMDVWPLDKQKRMIALFREMGLADQARVLEFGCGIGVFAGALKAALPNLEIHACDISPAAIAKARERFPNVTFHVLPTDGCPASAAAYDLVFTHHVLEHVQDLNAALSYIAGVLKPGGKVLHVFPCGNAGSLEYRITCMTKDGILPGGLFWIDDVSHVRRLTGCELVAASRSEGLLLRQAYFANQFWGALEYLTDTYPGTILGWLRTMCGRNRWTSVRLLWLIATLAGISVIRKAPAHVLKTFRHRRSGATAALIYAAVPFSILALPVSWLAGLLLQAVRDWEWSHCKQRPNGSEAYMTFQKELGT